MQHATKPRQSNRQLRNPHEEPRPFDSILADVARQSRPNERPASRDNDDIYSPPINVEIGRPQQRKERAAYTKTLGRIVTKVWAQRTTWDGVVWRVSQYRQHSDTYGSGWYRSFHFDDLNDAMRGLYRAQRWIRRAERRRRPFWWFW